MKFLSRGRSARRYLATVSVVAMTSLAATACGAGAGGGSDADSAELPGGKFTFVIPYAPGGSTDNFGRLFVEGLEKELDRSVTVENVDGAGATIGIAQTLTSKADGTTIGMGTNTALTFQPLVSDQLPWKTSEDYEAFGAIADTPGLLVTGKKSGYGTFDELIAAAKAKPGDVSLATTGANTLAHISSAQLEQVTGVKFNIVHFPSASEAMTAVIGGHVDGFSTTPSSAKGQVASGDLTALAVLSDTPDPALPDVPTITDLGYDPTVSFSLYVIAPPGLPEGVKETLETAVTNVLESDDFKSGLEEQGGTAGPIGLSETEKSLDDEQKSMEGLVDLMQ